MQRVQIALVQTDKFVFTTEVSVAPLRLPLVVNVKFIISVPSERITKIG